MTLQYKFVETIPEVLEEGILYITLEHCTALHKCICGCGNEVVTPIAPNEWQLSFNGKSVSLKPSIGNWRFPCRSHYFITNNEIIMVPEWSEKCSSSKKKKKKSFLSFRKKKKRYLGIILI